MGLFDRLKETTDGLVQAAKEKTAEVTGIDTDKLLEAADSVVAAGENISAAAESRQEDSQ